MKYLKYFSVLMIIFTCLFLNACTNKPVKDNKEEPNIVVNEVKLKRTNLNYKLIDFLPLSYISYADSHDGMYSNTPLVQQFNTTLAKHQFLLDDLLSFYNTIINKTAFYNNNTTKINDVNNYEVIVNSFKYNGFEVLTDLDLLIKGNSSELNLTNYKFQGDFQLVIKKVLNENNVADVTINLILNNKYSKNNINGISIFISEKKSFTVKFYKNNDNIESLSYITLNKLSTNYTEITGYEEHNEINNNYINKYLIYANAFEGVIYNNYSNNNNNYTDVEVFSNTKGLLFKSLSQNIVNEQQINTYSSYVGWPNQYIENYDSSVKEVSNNYSIKYGTKEKIVDIVGEGSFTTIDMNIYNKESYLMSGYFVNTKEEANSIYKFVFDIDKLKYPNQTIPNDIKLQVMSNVLYLYRWELINSGVIIDYEKPNNILDININKNFNELGYTIKTGYDENQSYTINIYQGNKLTDFIYLKGLFYHINDIVYESDRFIAFGQKEGKAYTLIFKLDKSGKIIKDDIYEYNHRRYGIFTTGYYDLNKKQYVYTMELNDKTIETLSLLENELMLPLIEKHIKYNHSNGTYIEPKYIVIHETGFPVTNADGLYWFYYWNEEPNAQASTQFVVDETTVVQMMDLRERAWHVGDNKGYSQIFNSNTVGIEICINDDGDYFKARQNAINLTIYLMKELKLTPNDVVRHKDASGKYCPRYMLDHPELWEDFINQLWTAYNNFEK